MISLLLCAAQISKIDDDNGFNVHSTLTLPLFSAINTLTLSGHELIVMLNVQKVLYMVPYVHAHLIYRPLEFWHVSASDFDRQASKQKQNCNVLSCHAHKDDVKLFAAHSLLNI